MIVAVDPGKTTGIAEYAPHLGKFDSYEMGFDETCAFVENRLSAESYDVELVSEAFIITPNTGKNSQAPWSLELIGVMRYLSRTKIGRDLVLQMPAAAKRFASDDRLRTVGFWTPARGHANDAARHLLLYTAQRGIIPAATLKKIVDVF